MDALETENDGVREAYESLQAEVRGLRASIENQIREGLDKIGKEIKTKQPSAPAVAPADADCDRAIANPQSYNERLYMAIAMGDSPSALRLIRSGATLDDHPNRLDWNDPKNTYPHPINRNAASVVLFEDFRWKGRSVADFTGVDAGYLGATRTEPDKSLPMTTRYQGVDGRDEADMLQIIDLLANNPCPSHHSGFRLWIPSNANPINWTPALVERAYAKNLMPPETEWSLLNAVYAYAHLSPLLTVVKDSSGDDIWRGQEYRPQNEPRHKQLSTRPLKNLPGNAYLQYEERLLEQTEDMLKLARDLGQVSIQPGARNSPTKFYLIQRRDRRSMSVFPDPEAPPEYA